jgi:hypothetical protein
MDFKPELVYKRGVWSFAGPLDRRVFLSASEIDFSKLQKGFD